MERDSVDFRNMHVGKLFTKQLFPTLLGMIASALFVVIDGIFVGNGIGSDAIAAVNIVAPVMMLITGVGLMFGMGGGILASINLSRGKRKVANINLTQSMTAILLVSIIMTTIFCLIPDKIGYLFGSDDYLIGMVEEYFFWYSISLPFTVMMVALPFFIRLTNPKISMWALLIGAVLNVILDYIFIFVFEWGLFGAAIATDISEMTGAVIMLCYLFKRNIAVHFVKLKISVKSILLTFRNMGYMVRLGFSVFLSEITISVMIISGNFAFMKDLGPNGVAAFSIICYLFPIIFMVFSATVQSAQPIISYNYGCGQLHRSTLALRYALGFALGFALIIMLVFMVSAKEIVALFIPDATNIAGQYAKSGLPLFATDFIFFGINIIMIGYYTSLERLSRAIILTIFRGVLPVIYFYILPLWIGVSGIWLAVAAADVTTTLLIFIIYATEKVKKHGSFGKVDYAIK